MFWEKVFGDSFAKVKSFAKERNLTVAALVRVAVLEFIKKYLKILKKVLTNDKKCVIMYT